MRDISALLLILAGNCLRKEREHREAKNAKAIFPRFSPSAVLAPPPSFLPLLEPGNLSEKAQNKAAKEKRKQVKAVWRRRRGREGKAVRRAERSIS